MNRRKGNFSFFNNILNVTHNITGGSMKKYKLLVLLTALMLPINAYAYSDYIIPGGNNIGIEIDCEGVLVTGFYRVNGKYNNKELKVGDYIINVNNTKVLNTSSLIELIDKYSENDEVDLTIKRDGKYKDIKFNLEKVDNKYKTGLYVKDSLTGIGTLTYIDPETRIYGALGHEVIESNTKENFSVEDGEIFKSDVSSIDRSVDGKPGTKNAKFYYNEDYGDIKKNTIHGIYGEYTSDISNNLMKVGNPDELKKGKASIYTVLDGNEVKEYEINITKIDKNNKIKNIYFEIVDKELLDRCGGIVQGMSGSPIIQDNKIYGAVTHVVVEDVSKGYGVFITTMLSEGEK